jgi:hypothetical protein
MPGEEESTLLLEKSVVGPEMTRRGSQAAGTSGTVVAAASTLWAGRGTPVIQPGWARHGRG